MHTLIRMRESSIFMTLPTNSMVTAPAIAMIDEANAICVRETFSVSPRTVKYRPGVLTIRPNPTRDNTQQPMNTSQGRLDDLVWVDIRTSMFAVVSSCVRRVGSIIESDRRTKGKQVLTFVIR